MGGAICVLLVCAGANLTFYSNSHLLCMIQMQCAFSEVGSVFLSVTDLNVRQASNG